MDDLKEALAATAEAAATHAKNAAERAVRIEALEQRVSELEEALECIRNGSPEVMMAAQEIWPTEYEMEAYPEDAVKRLFEKIVSAALNREPNP